MAITQPGRRFHPAIISRGFQNMFTTLKTLKVGERARVSGYAAGCPGYRHRLLTMGLTPGTELTVTRLAPLGDPIEVQVRGYSLSLRKDEAEVLQVERS
jgi:ferrous iron transport protein A